MLTIVNPAAAGGRLEREWIRLQGRLEKAGLTCEAVFTEAPYHAAELARGMAKRGAKRIVVAGGDGTVCEAAEGLAGGDHDCELGILPLGTGNDAARTLGIPRVPDAAADVAFNGQCRDVDLIRVGDRMVLNAIGIGLTADINQRAAKIKSCAASPCTWEPPRSRCSSSRAPEVRLVADGRVIDSTMTILAVHNGPTTGGGFALTPDAVPTTVCSTRPWCPMCR